MREAELPSIHDCLLISYEVNCEGRQIKCARACRPGCPSRRSVHLLRRVPLEQIVRQQRSELAASYRRAGAPGAWAADLNSAPEILAAKGGVKGFELSSSCGLSGWALAKSVAVVDG